MTALTADEASAPFLPDDPPPDIDSLRARIGAMDPTTQATFVAAWQTSGLTTALRDEHGTSLMLPAETAYDIEALVAAHEPQADDGELAVAFSRLHALPPGPQFATRERMHLFGRFNPSEAQFYTTGRLALLNRTLDEVTAEATDEVAGLLGPVVQGQVVAQPVADVAALALVPPTGTVDQIIAKIGDNLDLARATLEAELAKAKPRKGLVTKLSQVAGTAPPSAPPPAESLPIAESNDPAQMQGQLKIVGGGGDAAGATEASTVLDPSLDAVEDGYARGYIAGLRDAAEALRVLTL